jgi:hypothetical protein
MYDLTDRITRKPTHVALYLFEKLNYGVAKFLWNMEGFPSNSNYMG